MVRNCEMIIMPPIPQENPATTECGTLATWRPRRRTQKAIMMMEAEMQTFAAPEIPWARTAAAMKGTVTLEVPPMSTGLRPNNTQKGAEMIEV